MRLIAVLLLSMGVTFAQEGSTLLVKVVVPDGTSTASEVMLWPGGISGTNAGSNLFKFAMLPGGFYRIEVISDGYAAADTNILIRDGQTSEVSLSFRHTVITLPEVTVSVNRESNTLHSFSRRDIEAAPSGDLGTFLRNCAGLDVRDDGSVGGLKTTRIGGSSTDQVMVRIDGRRLQNSGTGEADLSAIPLDWIETVIVQRGGSPEFGGEAIGGVIDIITRLPTERPAYSIQSEYRDSYWRTSFTGSGTRGLLSTLLSFSRVAGNGKYKYRITEDDDVGTFTPHLGETFYRLNDDVVRDQLFGKLQARAGNALTMELTGTLDHSDRGMPGYLSPYLTPLARQQAQQETANLRVSQTRSHHSIMLRASYSHDARHYADPGIFGRSRSTDENGIQWGSEIENRFYRKGWNSAYGIGFDGESLTGSQLANGAARRNRYSIWTKSNFILFARLAGALRTSVEPGLRWESYDRSVAWLPRLEVRLEDAARSTYGIAVASGRSFHAPTLYSLFWLDDLAARGNPDLVAEVSQEVTARGWCEWSEFRIEAQSSFQNVQNQIYWLRTFDNYWKPFNLKSAHIQTLDLSARARLSLLRMELSSNMNWTEARDASDDRNGGGKYLTFRAPRSFRSTLSYHVGHFRASSNYDWTSARPVIGTNSKWLKAYDRLDFQGAYELAFQRVQIEVSAGVTNALNENYRIVRYAPMPLRQWYAGIKFSG